MVTPIPSSSSNSPLSKDFDAVLFDLDGVITPTARVHQRAWREVFEDVLAQIAEPGRQTYGDDDYHRYIDGRSRYEGVERLLGAHGVELPFGDPSDPPGVDTVCAIGNRKNVSFLSILEREHVDPFPGAMAATEALRSSGVPIALVSSSANARAVLAAAGLTDVFDVVVDGTHIRSRGLAGKPHPDPFLEAARLLGIDPGRCVVVEDAIAGVEAGRAGGFGLVVGVARDTDPDTLRHAGADVVIEDLRELV